MALQEKYAELINAATLNGVSEMTIREDNGVLFIDGAAASAEIKDQLWDIYDRIDPDYRSADLVLNISAPEAATEEYTVKAGDSLSKIARRYGGSWQDLYESNKDIIGENPDLIKIGQVLRIPKA